MSGRLKGPVLSEGVVGGGRVVAGHAAGQLAKAKLEHLDLNTQNGDRYRLIRSR